MSFMLLIKTKVQIGSQLCLYSAKEIFFNYQVFEIEFCQWVGGFWVGGSVGHCSVGNWLVVGWSVVGGSVVVGFNKTYPMATPSFFCYIVSWYKY